MSITCKQATDLISKNEERKLSIRQRYELWKHIASCSLCKLFYKQNKVIANTFATPGIPEQQILAPEEKEEIIRLMQQDN